MKWTPLFGHPNNGGSFLLCQNLQKSKRLKYMKSKVSENAG